MPTLGLTAGTRCLIGLIRVRSLSFATDQSSAAGYSPSPRPERAALESLTYQSKGARQEAGAVCHTLARPERHRKESSAHEEDAHEEARGVAHRLGSFGLR